MKQRTCIKIHAFHALRDVAELSICSHGAACLKVWRRSESPVEEESDLIAVGDVNASGASIICLRGLWMGQAYVHPEAIPYLSRVEQAHHNDDDRPTTFALRDRMDGTQLLERRLRDDDDDMRGLALGCPGVSRGREAGRTTLDSKGAMLHSEGAGPRGLREGDGITEGNCMTLLLVVRLTPLPPFLGPARCNPRPFSDITLTFGGRMDDFSEDLGTTTGWWVVALGCLGMSRGLEASRPAMCHSEGDSLRGLRGVAIPEVVVRRDSTVTTSLHKSNPLRNDTPRLSSLHYPALWDLLDATPDLFSDITLAFGGRMDVYFSEDLWTTTGWWVVALGCLSVSRGLEASRICSILINLASKPSNKSPRHQTLQLFVTTTTNVGRLRCGLAGKQRTMCHSEGDSLRGLREGVGIIEGEGRRVHLETVTIIEGPRQASSGGEWGDQGKSGQKGSSHKTRRRSEPSDLTAWPGASIEVMGQASLGGEADSQGMRDRAGIRSIERDEGHYAKAFLFFVRGVGWNVPVTPFGSTTGPQDVYGPLNYIGRARERANEERLVITCKSPAIHCERDSYKRLGPSERAHKSKGLLYAMGHDVGEKRWVRAIDSEQI
ncbi:hypothetical protein B0H34DRAFT_679567 [Crassisporium funariophilum]|nr:hypothetical protein B0H34DRAFT_679567 [Crassisporium funariophilum]